GGGGRSGERRAFPGTPPAGGGAERSGGRRARKRPRRTRSTSCRGRRRPRSRRRSGGISVGSCRHSPRVTAGRTGEHTRPGRGGGRGNPPPESNFSGGRPAGANRG